MNWSKSVFRSMRCIHFISCLLFKWERTSNSFDELIKGIFSRITFGLSEKKSMAGAATVRKEAGTMTFHTIMRNLIFVDRSINLEKVDDMAPCVRTITHRILNPIHAKERRAWHMEMDKQRRNINITTTNSNNEPSQAINETITTTHVWCENSH